MDRDRSLDRSLEPAADNDPPPSFGTSFKPLSGVKLPKFYTEDVNAWIAIMEDQFYLSRTSEHVKIALVLAPFKLQRRRFDMVFMVKGTIPSSADLD
jgi:hypothetical protein